MIITTDRLRLRSMELRDIAEFVRYLNDWEVQQWLWIPPYPYAATDGEAYLKIVQSDHATTHPTAFVIADGSTDSALGTTAIGIDGQGNGELGYWFGRQHWGHGFAREAVKALLAHARSHPRLRQLLAVTDPDNVRSQQVLLACGLTDLGLRDRSVPNRRGATRERCFELVLGT